MGHGSNESTNPNNESRRSQISTCDPLTHDPLTDDYFNRISRITSITFYSSHNARIASAVLATAIPSVRPSVRHTPVLCQIKTTARSTVQFALFDSKMCLVL